MSDRLFQLEQEQQRLRAQVQQGLSAAQAYENIPQTNRLMALEQSLDLSRQLGYGLSEVESGLMNEVRSESGNSDTAMQMGILFEKLAQNDVQEYIRVLDNWDVYIKDYIAFYDKTSSENQRQIDKNIIKAVLNLLKEIYIVLKNESKPQLIDLLKLKEHPKEIKSITVFKAPNRCWLISNQTSVYKILLNIDGKLEILPEEDTIILLSTDELQQQWLDAHNTARKQEGITNELTWDSELAAHAKDFVAKTFINEIIQKGIDVGKGFNLKHDLYHIVEGVKGIETMGQNLAAWSTQQTTYNSEFELLRNPQSENFKTGIASFPEKAVKDWMGEKQSYVKANGEKINNNTEYLSKGGKSEQQLKLMDAAGHYTQVIWPQTKKIGGCIAILHRILKRDKTKGTVAIYQVKVIAICNYLPGGNIWKQ